MDEIPVTPEPIKNDAIPGQMLRTVAPPPPGAPPKAPKPAPMESEQLAYVEGFLIGLARRLDDLSRQYSGNILLQNVASEAASDCREVAASIMIIGVRLARKPEDKPK